MKIVVLNGSARKGNTLSAVKAFMKGAEKEHEVELIQPDKLDIASCKGCGACQCYKGCVDQDDTNSTVEKIVNADLIVFASPVYWWGISGQLKTLIDKCYCRGAQLKGKKVGVIIVGGASTDNEQYDLIKKQFDLMAAYLSWDIKFFKKFSATAKDALEKDAGIEAELSALGESIAE